MPDESGNEIRSAEAVFSLQADVDLIQSKLALVLAEARMLGFNLCYGLGAYDPLTGQTSVGWGYVGDRCAIRGVLIEMQAKI